MFSALVRKPGSSFVRAISQHPEKKNIDLELARDQHQLYVATLELAGAEIIYLPELDDCPDAVFVEDTAIIVEGKAFICSMGAQRRKEERSSVLLALEKIFPTEIIDASISIDGGDILQTEDFFFIGLSKRTNTYAVDFFRKRTKKKVIPVTVPHCLHLKTAVSIIGRNTLIIDPKKISHKVFQGFNLLTTTPAESYAANALAIGDSVIMAEGFPKLTHSIKNLGLRVLQTPMSEFEKADGGITCLSLKISEQKKRF